MIKLDTKVKPTPRVFPLDRAPLTANSRPWSFGKKGKGNFNPRKVNKKATNTPAMAI